VVEARVNLTARRVAIRWRAAAGPPPLVETLAALGYRAHLDEPDPAGPDATRVELIRALAVAGFAAGNIMLLSVSVWSGAEPATRSLFHWLSALIALPALAYSGRVFYRSAWAALRHGRTNMDVPISIGVALAFGMSLYDTIHHGQAAYFDASVMLLFFLLIGRTLDHLMREKARTAVKGLARLAARGAMVERADGTRAYLPVAEILPGATVLLAAGERVPVDARVQAGTSDLDCSLVTGESAPRPVAPGDWIAAGTLNLTQPLRLEAVAVARDSFLAEMVRLVAAAEAGRTRYRRLADRAARLYSPAVHSLAALGFLGWLAMTGDVHRAATIAVAVLIITCPCALGLAVPIVQVVAARRLFEQGIMVKEGAGLERLAEVDTVVLDKTGTLTLGQPSLHDPDRIAPADLGMDAALAAQTRQPWSRALVAAQGARGGPVPRLETVTEQAGYGLEALSGTDVIRLGRPDWALDDCEALAGLPDRPRTALAKNGKLVAAFELDDPIRPGARESIDALRRQGLAVEILSGDHKGAVERLAGDLGIGQLEAGALPRDKVARLAALSAAGHKVLMVGDGLNDAPALAAAHASMAPSSAADVGRNAADLVFLREGLEAVPLALAIARRAAALVRENLALAILYNLVAVPFALAGLVTPLVAALAMSSSSILVVANAMRLAGRPGTGRGLFRPRRAATGRGPLAPAVQAAE
jgi:Cu2+-exporting ATPase